MNEGVRDGAAGVEGRFAGRVVLITGAGSGIGAATAHRFAREGATVVAVGRTKDKLENTVAGAAPGGTVVAQVADVADPRSVGELVDEVVGRYGRLDVLVNNAAVVSFGTTCCSGW
jgi:meso-butanediol dehydrogenase / (S,S)-butanediol dehydrogenase / diacetyl reductase